APAAVTQQPATPAAQPPARTGTRPKRSIARPAGNAAKAAEARNTAGPRPRIDSIPVTSTSVVVATAATSCSMPERQVSVAARRTVLRRTMRGSAAIAAIEPHPASPAGRSAVVPVLVLDRRAPG